MSPEVVPEFDTDLYLVNFLNGVYDARTCTFRRRMKDDYLTMSMSMPLDLYKFNNDTELAKLEEDNEKDILEVLSKIHPNEDVRRLHLIILATGLIGRNIEPSTWAHRARANQEASKQIDKR